MRGRCMQGWRQCSQGISYGVIYTLSTVAVKLFRVVANHVCTNPAIRRTPLEHSIRLAQNSMLFKLARLVAFINSCSG